MKRLLSILLSIPTKIRAFFSGKFKLFLALLFIGVFGFLVLPNLSFKINDQVVTLPSLDFSATNENSILGNFRRGRDIFPTQEVKSVVDFGLEETSEESKIEFLNLALKTVSNRITRVGLHDIDVRSEISGNEYSLIFTYPEYYKNIVETTRLLSRKGEITFVNPSDQQELAIKDSDIASNIDIAYTPNIQSHLKFNYNQDKSTDFLIALSQQYFYMSIDGIPDFQMFQYEQTDSTTNTVRGLPLNTLTQTDIAFRDLYINITRSYFTEKIPLKYASTPDQNIKTIPAQYSNLSVRYIAIVSTVVFIALAVFTFIKFGIRKGFAFSFMTLTYLVFTVALLKYISASISLNFLIAYFIMSAVSTLLIWRFINVEEKADLNLGGKQLTRLGILLMILCLLILRFVPTIGRFYDMVSVIFIFGFSYLVFGFFNFKALTEQIILKYKKR